MHWIAPSERDIATDTLEKRLWNTADQFRANSGLTAAQYSAPVLGLILFAETRFVQRHAALLPSPAGGTAEGGGEGAFSPLYRKRGEGSGETVNWPTATSRACAKPSIKEIEAQGCGASTPNVTSAVPPARQSATKTSRKSWRISTGNWKC